MSTYATAGSIACRARTPSCHSTPPSSPSTQRIMRGLTASPRLANVAYAAVSSSGVTDAAPSAIAGSCGMSLAMPAARAAPVISSGPITDASRTVGTLRELTSDSRIVSRP